MTKSQNGFSAVLVFFVLLIIAGVSLVGYRVYSSQQKSSEQQQSSADGTDGTSVDKADDAKGVVSALSTLIDGETATNSAIPRSYQVPGYEYATTSNNPSPGFQVQLDRASSGNLTSRLSAALKKIPLSEKIEQAGTGDEMYIANYDSTEVLCQVTTTHSYASSVRGGNDLVSLRCIDVTYLTMLASEQLPFYNALKKKHDSLQLDKLSVIGRPEITDSQSSGYSLAVLGVSGSAGGSGAGAYFYKANGGEWVHFRVAQSIAYCSEFNSAELRKAYLGTKCLAADGLGTEMVSL